MLRFLSAAVLLLTTAVGFGQEFLPQGMTNYEKSIWEDYIKNYDFGKGTTPPEVPPRTPAEFEENQGVIVTWTQFKSNLREIVRYAKESVKVYIVCSSASEVTTYLAAGNVDTQNIEFIEAGYNSVWVRDYGPQSVYLNETNELAFVDWIYNRPRPLDDKIPGVMAAKLGLPLYQMTTTPNRLVATGGNFMTDGFDRGFSSKLILTENSSLTESQVDSIAKRYMGIKPYIKMNVLPFDGIHHIDMHMKLIDDETLLVGQYPEGVADGPQIEANLQNILNNYHTPYGRPYRVVRIPMPADESGSYPNNNSDYLTYTNSIILNNLVLVPIYGLSTDNTALNIYRSAMPGYNIVGINMRDVIPYSGAIHCITHEIAANDPIFIEHAAIRDTMSYIAAGYRVSAKVSTSTGVSTANLYWSKDTTQGFDILTMTAEGEEYFATIPASLVDTDIYYYIEVKNNNNKTIRRPLVAPEGVYHFYAQGSTSTYYTLTIAVDGNGTTTPNIGEHQIAEGQTVELSATSAPNTDFVKWIVNSQEHSDSIITITVNANISATAYFEPTSTIDNNYLKDIALYPNPAYNSISVDLPNQLKVQSLKIYDIAGVEINSLNLDISKKSHIIDLSNYKAGIYFLNITTSESMITLKFVKISQ